MRKAIRNFLSKLGYDIIKTNYTYKRDGEEHGTVKQEFKWLTNYNFKTIIDIGSNEGQSLDKFRYLFPNAMLYCFEPIPKAFNQLKKNFELDKRISFNNIGIGNEVAEVEFNLNQYTQSSSLLELSEEHKHNFTQAVNTSKIQVKIDTLDNFFKDVELEKPYLIKIDVQGYEDKVVTGGKDIISEAAIVISEVSYRPMYEGQMVFDDLQKLFADLGFTFIGNAEQLYSPQDNKILQADAIFENDKIK